MIQKIIAYLYQKKVTKTYNDNNDGFICNFVLEYKDKGDFVHKMACYAVNFEPVVIGKENRYLVEVDVHAVQNVKYNNDRVWLPQCKVIKMDLLLQPWEITSAEKEIERYYDEQRKFMEPDMTAKPEEIVWFESTISENVEPEVSFVEQEKEEVLVSCTWY